MQLEAVQTGLQRAGFTNSVGIEDTENHSKSAISIVNYPNPFSGTTHLIIGLALASRVRLNIYDLLGRHVETLVDAHRVAGRHEEILDLADYASGIYVVTVEAAGTVEMVKLVKMP